MGGQGSGRKPDLNRRKEAAELRARGLRVAEIAVCLGITPQAVSARLRSLRPKIVVCRVPCSGCGTSLGRAARHRDEGVGLCLACLGKKPNATFSERLRAHRLAAGLTALELAGQAGTALQTILALEQNQRRPSAGTLGRLAKALRFGQGQNVQGGACLP